MPRRIPSQIAVASLFSVQTIFCVFLCLSCRVAEVARRHEGLSPKSFDSDENFKPLNTLFCREIKICRDLRNF